MTCKGCQERKESLKWWFRDLIGQAPINLALKDMMVKTNRDACQNINQLESHVTTLQRQLKAMGQTLQQDYVLVGDAIDALHKRLELLEVPGEDPHVDEPHKAH